MPVIVIGADTPLGEQLVGAFDPGHREIRAFVSDPTAAARLKQTGCKVAIGDISDGSHVGGAARRSFSAVLFAEATHDDRERAFAATPGDVVTQWVDGLRDAGVRRIIWVDDGAVPDPAERLRVAGSQVAIVHADGLPAAEAIAQILKLDEAAELAGDA
jgi:hypothetical protein